MQEVGWLRLPTLMHMGWAGQWLLYEEALRANLSRPALTIPILANQVRLQDRKASLAAVVEVGRWHSAASVAHMCK